MAHISVSAAEEIIDQVIPCLDHGFVRLIDYMGSDESIVQAARVSYGKGTKKVRQDRSLIRYLLRHGHTSPFEMVEFKFHCKMPIFVARQWIRHRTASVNEYSLRYSKAVGDFYIPESENIRFQSKSNRQGRSEETVPDDLKQHLLDVILAHSQRSWQDYEELEAKNIARELARIHLPLNMYTEWYWKIDLSNLLHFIKLRSEVHAQYEIRIYAQAISEIVKKVVPLTWEAFTDYVYNARTFSKVEMDIIRKILESQQAVIDWEQIALDNGLEKLEAQEFAAKFDTENDIA
ncbi:FAD-dependent thymidylate synthase [candidate division KSB1 bacterium]|nr:FAD-dependent thymidylate synthase [candidate division KSB1 bacterium]